MISDATQGNATKFKDDIDLGLMFSSIGGSEVDFGDGVGKQPVHLLDEPEAKKPAFCEVLFLVLHIFSGENHKKLLCHLRVENGRLPRGCPGCLGDFLKG